MSFSITGPNIVTPGIGYVYTVSGFSSCIQNEVQGTVTIPPGWILVSQTPIVGDSYTFTVVAGSSAGTVGVNSCGCTTERVSVVGSPSMEVSIGNTIKSNIGICCNNFAVASLDASSWVNNTSNPVTLTITFGNQTDADEALGVHSFTSTSNVSLPACLLNLVSQINAAAASRPSQNPEGVPASLLGGQLSIVSWPTANDATECGDTTNYLFGFQVTCNMPGDVTMEPLTTADFINGGSVINCGGPSSITGPSFVCTGNQYNYIITFPGGIPGNYTITPPKGWTVSSTTATGPDTIVISLIPNNSSGVLTVSDNNGSIAFSSSAILINDCFLQQCASKMLLSQFCRDIDPCCTECSDTKKKDREIEANNMNKAIGLITTYSLAKQNYFLSCNPNDLNNILSILNQLNSILVRCNICPQA